jgi:NAD+--dinitrogen-reductase ADP-D-ribosyltransferase
VHSTNFVGIPTGLLASTAYNEFPATLHIHGVRETNPALFRMLADSTCVEDGIEAFCNYMRTVFEVDAPPTRDARGRKRYRSSYLRLLRGWGFDANAREGAVLPTYHKVALGHFPSPAWMSYVEEKMSPRFHNNSIFSQLDLLYEYAHWMLAHYLMPGKTHLTLYRGVNDFAEHQLLVRTSKREAIARQNNLISFSQDRDVADRFGDTILEVEVPITKILFFNDLLPGHVLKGEGEFLVIGGDFRVRLAYL